MSRKENFFLSIIGATVAGFIISYIEGLYPIDLVTGMVVGAGIALYDDYRTKEE